LPALFLPILSKSVTTCHAVVNPIDLPIDAASDIRQQSLLEIADGMSDIGRENGV